MLPKGGEPSSARKREAGRERGRGEEIFLLPQSGREVELTTVDGDAGQRASLGRREGLGYSSLLLDQVVLVRLVGASTKKKKNRGKSILEHSPLENPPARFAQNFVFLLFISFNTKLSTLLHPHRASAFRRVAVPSFPFHCTRWIQYRKISIRRHAPQREEN